MDPPVYAFLSLFPLFFLSLASPPFLPETAYFFPLFPFSFKKISNANVQYQFLLFNICIDKPRILLVLSMSDLSSWKKKKKKKNTNTSYQRCCYYSVLFTQTMVARKTNAMHPTKTLLTLGLPLSLGREPGSKSILSYLNRNYRGILLVRTHVSNWDRI